MNCELCGRAMVELADNTGNPYYECVACGETVYT
jgi:hypothetical protein